MNILYHYPEDFFKELIQGPDFEGEPKSGVTSTA